MHQSINHVTHLQDPAMRRIHKLISDEDQKGADDVD